MFPIIAGAVAIVVVLAVCLVGGAAALMLRGQAVAGPTAAPAPSVWPTRPDIKSGPECLIGDWIQTNITSTAEIGGVTVRLTGEGTVARYAADGTYAALMDNVVLSGTAGGDSYEVIFHGSLTFHYAADETTIRYSSPASRGITTWKINGMVRTSEPISATLEPDTYRCEGNELRLFWREGAAEYQRTAPAGVRA